MLKFLTKIKQVLSKQKPKETLDLNLSIGIIIINNKEYSAPKEVLDLLLIVSKERDYYEELLFSSQRIINHKPTNNNNIN